MEKKLQKKLSAKKTPQSLSRQNSLQGSHAVARNLPPRPKRCNGARHRIIESAAVTPRNLPFLDPRSQFKSSTFRDMLAFSTCWNNSRHTDGKAMVDEILELGFEHPRAFPRHDRRQASWDFRQAFAAKGCSPVHRRAQLLPLAHRGHDRCARTLSSFRIR